MSKNKLARALSARHEEKWINCAKKCPPTCKETGNWKSEESPTSQSRLCRGGASLQIPKPLPEAGAAWGGEKALRTYRDSFQFLAGTCRQKYSLLREWKGISTWQVHTAEPYHALIKILSCISVPHFPLRRTRLTDSSLSLAQQWWLLGYREAKSQIFRGWWKVCEKWTNTDFKP